MTNLGRFIFTVAATAFVGAALVFSFILGRDFANVSWVDHATAKIPVMFQQTAYWCEQVDNVTVEGL